MSAILRCSGEKLDIDQLQKYIDLEVDQSWRKGEKRNPRSSVLNKYSGISFYASDADMEEFNLQVRETIEWLHEFSEQITEIVSFEGIEEVTLDFGIALKEDNFVNSDYLPPELLQIAGRLGIGIELSHYPVSKDD
jgi:hypothetical protein